MNDSSESARPAAIIASTTVARVADGGSVLGAVAPQERSVRSSQARGGQRPERGPVQLSLFPAPGQPQQLCAPLFHVRCHDCQAINDVPSLPTICYVCRCPLGREHPPF